MIDLILDQLMLRDFSHWILIELIDSLHVKVAEDSIKKKHIQINPAKQTVLKVSETMDGIK